MNNDGFASGYAFGYDPTRRSVVLNRQNTLFDVRCWTFSVRFSPVHLLLFRFDQPFFEAGGGAEH
ncbi:hypothetical protein D1AOALGA4SA_5895 [Olavius algarvensis Delta 1 endosymbiont]|nr:hypothetical protein D1AOALGA4SA_5895 [Olavius algarvensis Delta 1 endosymbiont]